MSVLPVVYIFYLRQIDGVSRALLSETKSSMLATRFWENNPIIQAATSQKICCAITVTLRVVELECSTLCNNLCSTFISRVDTYCLFDINRDHLLASTTHILTTFSCLYRCCSNKRPYHLSRQPSRSIYSMSWSGLSVQRMSTILTAEYGLPSIMISLPA